MAQVGAYRKVTASLSVHVHECWLRGGRCRTRVLLLSRDRGLLFQTLCNIHLTIARASVLAWHPCCTELLHSAGGRCHSRACCWWLRSRRTTLVHPRRRRAPRNGRKALLGLIKSRGFYGFYDGRRATGIGGPYSIRVTASMCIGWS